MSFSQINFSLNKIFVLNKLFYVMCAQERLAA